MIFLTLNGLSKKDIPIKKYLIDWAPEREVSGPQGKVKAFLRPYWGNETVLEEMRIPGSRLRLDLFNVNRGIVVEIDGAQHDKPNLFMHGSFSGFKASVKRDLAKERWAEMNKLTYVVIKEKEIPLLSAEWIEATFGVIL